LAPFPLRDVVHIITVVDSLCRSRNITSTLCTVIIRQVRVTDMCRH